MDPERFDTLARSLTATGTRRRALAILSGVLSGVLSLALGASSPDEAAAKKQCPPCKKRKKGKCKKKLPDGTACTGGACQDGRCVTVTAPPPLPTCGTGGPCLVFVTSSTHKGDLGGIAGADGTCGDRAREASLPGTYKAWLSDSTGSPDSRFVQSTDPYRRVDGVTVADNYTDLTTCDSSAPFACLDNPIDLAEDGLTRTNNALVWTNTVAGGTAEDTEDDCDDWSKAENALLGNIGMSDPIVTDANWTDLGSVMNCDVALHLYCFQQS